MNKEMLYTLSVNELNQNISRLHVGISQLMELLTALDEEKQELLSTKEMLIKTLVEIAPKEESVVNRFISSAKTMWTGFWRRQVRSEDSEEWKKIMEEFK